MFKTIKLSVVLTLILGLLVTGAGEVFANADDVCQSITTCEETCQVKTWSAWDTVNHRRTGSGLKECSTSTLTCFMGGLFSFLRPIISYSNCSIYQYDKTVPSCEFREVGPDLQFRCVPNGASDCQNYKTWTKVNYAVTGKLTTIGIGTEAGIYNACKVPYKK